MKDCMKKKSVIIILCIICCAIYILGYYSAQKNCILVRRLNFAHTDQGVIQCVTYSITHGNLGPGKRGILVSPVMIQFCYFVFTPLRLLEAKHQNRKLSFGKDVESSGGT